MLVIISPAKKLNFETIAPIEDFTQNIFLKQSQKLINHMKKLNHDDIKKMMKLSDALCELNISRYKSYKTPFTLKNSKQAIYAFEGDTYKGLDALTLKKNEIKYAQKHLKILSGLYGLIAPLDLIMPYRLEMGTKVKIGDSKNLYEFWGDALTNELNKELKKEKYLINLASKEYFSSVDFKKLNGKVITPIFKEKKGSDYKVVGLFSKRARGMMSRFIIQNKITDPLLLKKFDDGGYSYSEKHSTGLDMVFIR